MPLNRSRTKIICPNCGKKYYLIEEDYPMRDKDELHCDKCNFLLKEWNAAVIYCLEECSDEED